MFKFTTGDRVVMVKRDPNFDPNEPPNGSLGTVQENSSVPWVFFDGLGRFVVDYTQIDHAPEPQPALVMPANPVTKIDKLKAHFLSGRSLTQLEALGLYGAFRLAARVHDLKAQGWKIDTFMKEDPNGNPYAEYKLRSKRV